MFKHALALLAFVSLANSPTHADAMTDAAQDLCETVKSCTLGELAEEDMTPEMRQMMEPMLEKMCTNMRSGVAQVPIDHPIYQPALACMRSMADLSCESMGDPRKTRTTECQAYEELAKKNPVNP